LRACPVRTSSTNVGLRPTPRLGPASAVQARQVPVNSRVQSRVFFLERISPLEEDAMNAQTSRLSHFGLSSLILFVAMVQPAVAGTPLLCHPFDIGTAESLPWGTNGWKAPRSDYQIERLAGDTLRLLTPQTPIIVRMETLRRAAIYGTENVQAGKELLSRLMMRMHEAEKKGRPDALAYFDTGYLIETFKQAGPISSAIGRFPIAEDGYQLVVKALTLREGDPAIEFAAALISAHPKRSAYDVHAQKARTGAMQDPLLARNVKNHISQ
ncbi:MAG: hypothetical protein ACRD1T_15060, partial [Acidimicrobiia bacterium]